MRLKLFTVSLAIFSAAISISEGARVKCSAKGCCINPATLKSLLKHPREFSDVNTSQRHFTRAPPELIDGSDELIKYVADHIAGLGDKDKIYNRHSEDDSSTSQFRPFELPKNPGSPTKPGPWVQEDFRNGLDWSGFSHRMFCSRPYFRKGGLGKPLFRRCGTRKDKRETRCIYHGYTR
jgi:hypothetical protein